MHSRPGSLTDQCRGSVDNDVPNTTCLSSEKVATPAHHSNVAISGFTKQTWYWPASPQGRGHAESGPQAI